MEKYRLSRDKDWKQNLATFSAVYAENRQVIPDLDTKLQTDNEIARRVKEFQFHREDRSYPAAWKQFMDLAQIEGSEENALLTISMRGALGIVGSPSMIKGRA